MDVFGRRLPVVFEALPTGINASPEDQEAHIAKLAPLADMDIAAINIPEVIDGDFRTITPREFGKRIQDAHGIRTIVNKITVHQSGEELIAWLRQTRDDYGINDVLLVGGEHNDIAYPGPSVKEALSLVRSMPDAPASVGVITIPTRRSIRFDEPERLLAKQRAGASYAISQILQESWHAVQLQRDLAAAARSHNVTPVPLFWSLAPITRAKDIDFLRWLGVQFPHAAEVALRRAPTAERRIAVSHEINESIARDLLEQAELSEHGPIGFCIEHVRASNMGAAFDLLQRVADLAAEFTGLPVPANAS